jgi:predicted phage replisome organizer
MESNKKYYWLKLKRDFFKRHDIMIIESMPNGKEYALFYLKLLLESIDHEGALRFSEAIPYNEQMISTITNTNIDIVRTAMKIFQQLNLVEMQDNQTIFMNEVNKMLGSETAWAEKKRQYRLGKEDIVPELSSACPPNVRQEIELEKETELEKDIINQQVVEEKSIAPRRARTTFTKPTLDEVRAYCIQRDNGIDPSYWLDYYEARGWMVGKTKMQDWKAAVRTWERNKQATEQKPANERRSTFNDSIPLV